MNLKKLFAAVIALALVLSVQAAFACVDPGPIEPIDPYDGVWQLRCDDCQFSYSIYEPVAGGMMNITPLAGGTTNFSIPIDQKTYPDFTAIDPGQKFDISFTVNGEDVDYTYYDGGWYTGLQLLNDDRTKKFGLVKIKCADPAPVPIPGAVWLLGAGLIGLAGFRKK